MVKFLTERPVCPTFLPGYLCRERRQVNFSKKKFTKTSFTIEKLRET